jgi:hypothetical protein
VTGKNTCVVASFTPEVVASTSARRDSFIGNSGVTLLKGKSAHVPHLQRLFNRRPDPPTFLVASTAALPRRAAGLP